MGKLIALIVFVIVAVWLLKRALSGPKPPPSAPAGTAQGELVSCAHCGVNLPKPEARSAGGDYFCSEEHWRLGPRKP